MVCVPGEERPLLIRLNGTFYLFFQRDHFKDNEVVAVRERDRQKDDEEQVGEDAVACHIHGCSWTRPGRR